MILLNQQHRAIMTLLLLLYAIITMASQDIRYIDTRDSGDHYASSGNQWRLITDQVMGGVSQGQLSQDTIDGQSCLRMQGDVSLENNGGFVQIGLNLSDNALHDVQTYTGLVLEVHGNDEQYNVHLRTADIRQPWQSYRATFTATPQWQVIYLPFADFEPHRIDIDFNIRRLERIGLVAIGRQFSAELCIGKIGFYR